MNTRLQKIALNQEKFETRSSSIAGNGNFAIKDISIGTNLGVGLIRISNSGNSDTDFIRNDICRFTNHSDSPNLDYRKNGNNYEFIVKTTIRKGDELTIDYGTFDFEGKRDFTKKAALKADVQLYPYQQRAVNRISKNDNTILAHPTGSGKTLTSLAGFEKLKAKGQGKRALVVVPASLRENYAKEGVKKFTKSRFNIIGNKQEIGSKKSTYGPPDATADYNIVSYELFRSNPEHYIRSTGADTAIFDELHRGKNITKTYKSIRDSRHLYKNFIGGTGSLVSNKLTDVIQLVDAATAGEGNLTSKENLRNFEKRYYVRSSDPKYKMMHEDKRPIVALKNKEGLKNFLKKYVDYVSPDSIQDIAKMPEKRIHEIEVPLSHEQAMAYHHLVNNNPKLRELISKRRYEYLKDDDMSKAFNDLAEARKLMNDVGTVKPEVPTSETVEQSPKTKALLDDTANYLAEHPEGKVLLSSFLIKGGTEALEAGLKNRHIQYGKFIGKGNDDVTEESRQADVKRYNKNRLHALIISGAGGEGLSLNDTNRIENLDPHFNPERTKQMEARGIRSGGLSGLPPEERKVDVNRYIATMPAKHLLFLKYKDPLKTPDEIINEMSKKKESQNKLLYDVLDEMDRNTPVSAPRIPQQKAASLRSKYLEKIADKKWHEMTREEQRALIDNDSLDYESMISHLNDKSMSMLKDLNVPITNANEKQLGSMIIDHGKGGKIKKGIKKLFLAKFLGGQLNPGGGYGKFTDLEVNKNLFLNVGNNSKSQFNNNMFNVDNNFNNYQTGKRSLNQRYMDALLLRHEVDEARATERIFKQHPEYIKRSTGLIKIPIVTSRYNSHFSPEVVVRESANVAVAPKVVREKFKNSRAELDDLTNLPDYGENAFYDEALADKMLSDIHAHFKTASLRTRHLEKTAASLDSRRGKQYWQLLKRLYGGTEEAVSALSKSHDPSIYHVTRSAFVKNIMSEGLKPGPYREYGVGTFFADKGTTNKVIEDSRIFGNRASRLRLKHPSELSGTKTMYPDVNKAMVLDTSRGNLKDIAPGDTWLIPDEYLTPAAGEENKLKYYGKLHDYRILRDIVRTPRHEFHFKDTTVPPELITRGNKTSSLRSMHLEKQVN